MRTLLFAALAGCVACGGSQGTDPTSSTGLVSAGVSEGSDGGSEAGAAEDFFRCVDHDDCVAVRYLEGCCYTGLKIAVNRREVAEYEQATACEPQRGHLCPMIIVPDPRIPICDEHTHLCAMVAPGGDGGDDGEDGGHCGDGHGER
jgi:hypothetical protein